MEVSNIEILLYFEENKNGLKQCLKFEVSFRNHSVVYILLLCNTEFHDIFLQHFWANQGNREQNESLWIGDQSSQLYCLHRHCRST